MKIPFKSKLTRFKNIQNRNKAFDNLSDIDKRKEIAYDALLLIINGQLMASKGCYWNTTLHNKTIKLKTPIALQEYLIDKLPVCEVCQRGLFMVSQIRLGNTISPFDENKEDGDALNLKGFDLDTFCDLEDEYESSVFDLPYRSRSNSKLANISCNVINNGNFNPEDTTDYLKRWDIKLNKY